MKGTFAGILLFCFYSAIAQGGPVGPFTMPTAGPTSLREVFRNHEVAEKPSGSTEGTPYLNENWLYARIKARGREQTYDSVKIKLNVQTGAILFLDENGEEMTVALKVDAVKFIDSASALNNKVFLSNFDQQPGFYEILEDGGKLKLLKRLRVFKWETQPVNSEKITRIEIQGDLYISSGNTLYNATKSCTAIRDAFEQNDKIPDYISQNNLHCNKEEDLRKMVKFYASLKQ
jgi:hypothetical protein